MKLCALRCDKIAGLMLLVSCWRQPFSSAGGCRGRSSLAASVGELAKADQSFALPRAGHIPDGDGQGQL